MKRELDRVHWLKSVQSFFCSDITALQRNKGHAGFCLLFCFQISHLQQRVLMSSIGKRQSAEREVGFQTPAGLTHKGLKRNEENVLPCFVVTSANI